MDRNVDIKFLNAKSEDGRDWVEITLRGKFFIQDNKQRVYIPIVNKTLVVDETGAENGDGKVIKHGEAHNDI